MLKLMVALALITSTSLASNAEDSLLSQQGNNGLLATKIEQQGVPAGAIKRVLEFLDLNQGKVVSVKHKFRSKNGVKLGQRSIRVSNKKALIIDFGMPSNEPRLFYIDLESGEVERHYVSHGKGSGVKMASRFSNINGSKMSSLGIYLTGDTYYGFHGQSLNLYGMEPSNSNAATRDIVMHGAAYAGSDFAKKNGRLGRSWGCPALPPQVMKKVLKTVPEGSVIYAYHQELAQAMLSTPDLQEIKVQDEEDIDLPGEEESLKNGKIAPRSAIK